MILLRIPTTATAAAAAAARGTRSLAISSSSSSSSACATISGRYSRRSLSGFSRMLDMGGAPSAMHDRSSTIKIQTSKNCKVQAICFDFEVLTSSLDAITSNDEALSSSSSSPSSSTSTPSLLSSTAAAPLPEQEQLKPDVNMIQQVASLLNVKLEGVTTGGVKKSIVVDDDSSDEDLSLLKGEERKKSKQASSSKNLGPLAPDIRQKYANKLFKRGVEGGVASVELAKHQVQETLKRGDAAGHLAARKMAAAEVVGSSSSSLSSSGGNNRWMAQTGTGALLQYLSQRSLKLGLLPRPSSTAGLADDNVNTIKQQGERMQNFQKQLPDVTFDVMMLDDQQDDAGSGGSSSNTTLDAQTIVTKTLQQLHPLQPELVLLVSDRDDYLKAAKEAGMVACRLRVPNARRGNVSAHYMVSSIPEVQEVVNEINGISYKAVLKAGR
jgi:hypothetical protein